MAWAKLDDGFMTHPKALAAGKDGRALFIAGLLYAARELTDGAISDTALPLIATAAEVRGKATAAKLVAVGLWETAGEGWQIHDYHDYNPSADAERSKRRARAEAGRKGGQRPKQHPKQPPSKSPSKPEANTEANTEATSKRNGTPSPSPSLGDLRPLGGIRENAPSTAPPKPVDKAEAVYEHIADQRPDMATRGNGYRRATINGIRAQHHQRAHELIHAHPDLTVEQIAQHLEAGTSPTPADTRPPAVPTSPWLPGPPAIPTVAERAAEWEIPDDDRADPATVAAAIADMRAHLRQPRTPPDPE
jgi:hypothetical protein